MKRRKCRTAKGLSTGFKQVIGNGLTNDKIQFVCIGTDRSTGDSLAPLVGTMLTQLGYTNVIGTIDDPLHNLNKKEKLKLIDPSKTVIAIDAAVGNKENIGQLSISEGFIQMGVAVRKDKEHNLEVGDYAIKGIVCRAYKDSHMNYLELQDTRLSMVLKMAQHIAEAIIRTYPCKKLMKV